MFIPVKQLSSLLILPESEGISVRANGFCIKSVEHPSLQLFGHIELFLDVVYNIALKIPFV